MHIDDIVASKAMGFVPETEKFSTWKQGGLGLICPCTYIKSAGKYFVKMPLEFSALALEQMEQEFETMAMLTGSTHTVGLATIPRQQSDIRLKCSFGIVMPFVPSITLQEIEGQMPDGLDRLSIWGASGMVSCLRCLVEAVAHLYSLSLFHGDIKNGNIMIDPSLQALTLIDFGNT